jgi:hypothetical protein
MGGIGGIFNLYFILKLLTLNRQMFPTGTSLRVNLP